MKVWDLSCSQTEQLIKRSAVERPARKRIARRLRLNTELLIIIICHVKSKAFLKIVFNLYALLFPLSFLTIKLLFKLSYKDVTEFQS